MEIEITIKIVWLNQPEDIDSAIDELRESIEYNFSDITGYNMYSLQIETDK